jgi:PPM family protein phosphatase
MQIQYYTYSNSGKRPYNEDNVYPVEAEVDTNYFIVCDGVGGHAKGEVASEKAISFWTDYLEQDLPPVLTQYYFSEGFEYVKQQFDAAIAEDDSLRDMATTLSMLLLNRQNAHIAHLGDSRVYHIREGKVLFQTQDHSLVNQLLASGLITEEEAIQHPQKNIITKALMHQLDENVHMSYTMIADVQAGDCFLLCTDGVVEGFPSNDEFEKLFSAHTTIEELSTRISDQCAILSNDNFTYALITIKSTAA